MNLTIEIELFERSDLGLETFDFFFKEVLFVEPLVLLLLQVVVPVQSLLLQDEHPVLQVDVGEVEFFVPCPETLESEFVVLPFVVALILEVFQLRLKLFLEILVVRGEQDLLLHKLLNHCFLFLQILLYFVFFCSQLANFEVEFFVFHQRVLQLDLQSFLLPHRFLDSAFHLLFHFLFVEAQQNQFLIIELLLHLKGLLLLRLVFQTQLFVLVVQEVRFLFELSNFCDLLVDFIMEGAYFVEESGLLQLVGVLELLNVLLRNIFVVLVDLNYGVLDLLPLPFERCSELSVFLAQTLLADGTFSDIFLLSRFLQLWLWGKQHHARLGRHCL